MMLHDKVKTQTRLNLVCCHFNSTLLVDFRFVYAAPCVVLHAMNSLWNVTVLLFYVPTQTPHSSIKPSLAVLVALELHSLECFQLRLQNHSYSQKQLNSMNLN